MKEITKEFLVKLLKQRKIKTFNKINENSSYRLDLSNVDLSGANLHNADLCNVNFRGVSFRGADLSYAEFRGADLSNADFRGADLSSADLSNADLSNADFRGADYSETDFSFADLHGANFSAELEVYKPTEYFGWQKAYELLREGKKLCFKGMETIHTSLGDKIPPNYLTYENNIIYANSKRYSNKRQMGWLEINIFTEEPLWYEYKEE